MTQVASVAVLHAGGVVTRDQQHALVAMEKQILEAVSAAKDAGVPQGFIVAVLHGHAQVQTNTMMGGGE